MRYKLQHAVLKAKAASGKWVHSKYFPKEIKRLAYHHRGKSAGPCWRGFFRIPTSASHGNRPLNDI